MSVDVDNRLIEQFVTLIDSIRILPADDQPPGSPTARKKRTPRKKRARKKKPPEAMELSIGAIKGGGGGVVIRRRDPTCRFVSGRLRGGPFVFETMHARSPEKSKGKPKSEPCYYEEYWDEEEVRNGLDSGALFKGAIRINPKHYQHAYVSQTDRTNKDFIIRSIAERNRALEGDVVVIEIIKNPESSSNDEQIGAKVVYISERIHPRTAIGTLKSLYNQRQKLIALYPRDVRIPRIVIPNKHVPSTFFKDSSKFEKLIFKATIVEWSQPKYAKGLVEYVGKKNRLSDEKKAILEEFELDERPVPDTLKKFIPKFGKIDAKEFEYREDLRKECVFTIDPLTARDLDDAVSCKDLPNGNLEIGVHIADVTYYLAPDTPLDDAVATRATSTYLVDSVIHMLPENMCLGISLLPGKDSLAFSVFWEMTPEGEILSHRFSRSIINNCCQLAYEHAQKIIDNESEVDFPKIHRNFRKSNIVDVVKKLAKIARNLRRKRFDSGALSINQIKIGFQLNEKGDPSDFFAYENTEANHLIEEFMLLANITVAKRILNDYPEIAFLRQHDPPNPRLMKETKSILEIVGIHLDISSSGGIYSSLEAYSTPDFFGKTRNMVLSHLLAKPMTRARYFCASLEKNFHHYALSTPVYTHFTSPIRRYADIMVHRLLSACLNYTRKPQWDANFVRGIAENCNKQKYNAKRAGEAHTNLFLLKYVDQNQPFVKEAVVVDVKEKQFQALVLCTGSLLNVHIKDVDVAVEKVGSEQKQLTKLVVSFETGQRLTIETFAIVRLSLRRHSQKDELHGELVTP